MKIHIFTDRFGTKSKKTKKRSHVLYGNGLGILKIFFNYTMKTKR